MIAVDSNILIYAHRTEMTLHERAAQRMRELAEGHRPWLIPWPCVHEFLSIVTHPKVYRTPTPMGTALRQVELWMASPSCSVVGESSHHWSSLKEVLVASKAAGPLVHDARIAAICLSNAAQLIWTADRDFSRFPLKTVNPLLAD